MSRMSRVLTPVGELTSFGVKALAGGFLPPYEWQIVLAQIEEIGVRSVPLVAAAGVALAVVTTLHPRSTLVSFGAEACAPAWRAASFFTELRPLVTALLVAGRPRLPSAAHS
jgi:phospholipid/cholesterol/gamma-HCH transport system permease protein